MKYRSLCGVILGLCAGQAAWADLTMRHTIEFKFGSFLPPAAVEAMKIQLGDQLPKETIVQIKGKKVYTSMGRMVMVADYARGVITLIDQKGKRFGTTSTAEYADKIAAVQTQKIPALPAQARQMFENMKFDVKTDRTGKTDTIQGIRAEESLLTISIEIPNPAGPGMQMRLEMHQWTASADEVNRIPALKELEVYATLPKEGIDPVELMTKSLASFPGMADKLKGPLEELRKNAGKATLRIATAIYMPSMAQMGGGAADQPFTEFTMELAELSSALVPDSRFDVPADYQSAPMEELLGALFPSPKPAIPTTGPKAELSAGEQPKILTSPPAPAGVFKVGGGVTSPAVRSKIEPAYTEEARAARIQGSVVLYVVVGPDGKARRMRVLRSLDPGLDQKAMEAVGAWEFKPGMKDGKPVSVEAHIEVRFRLM